MKIILTLFSLILFSCRPPDQTQAMTMNDISIIPQPSSTQILNTTFDLKSIKGIILKNGSEEERHIAALFQEYLKPAVSLSILEFVPAVLSGALDHIIISLDDNSEIPTEGYRLAVGEHHRIELKASSPSGLFYGFQTFRQLCPSKLENGETPKNTRIQNCKIVDSPTFGYRGMHLDVSRHFFDVDFIKTYIDMIALHKMNVFHWHLTDDNGWRIEIKKYPELTEKSAWRVDRTHEPWKEWSPIQPGEKASYGGYYTQDEIREVIQYASDQNIMVIPEIEMPGHTSEVFAAYPELSCRGDTLPVNPGSYWPNEDIFCAGNDDVFAFLENVLDEVIELFPGPYIHIGGDEATKTHWETCLKCQKRILDEGLKDEHELQSWFIKKIEKFILSKNKNLVGWDEILEGGLAPSATVMSWRGMKGGIESAKAGHDVIMCPVSHCYFDYYQANPETSPEAIGGFTTLKKVYSFNPIPEELSAEESKFVLGAQGNLWTEYVQTPDRAQYRVLPRMTALSEVLWSGPGKNLYDDFYRRLVHLQKRFDELGWIFAPGSFMVSIQANQESMCSEFRINLTSEKPGESIRFTLDESDPSIASPEFKASFSIDETSTVKAALFMDGKRTGKTSEKTIYFHKAIGKPVSYKIPHKQKYSGGGPLTLVDGLAGTTNYNDGYWQGWEGEDLDVVIDLGEPEFIEKISLSFLEAQGSWIFLPTEVAVSFSDEGNSFKHEKKLSLIDGKKFCENNRKVVDMNSLNSSGRFVRVQAINRKICPEWHDGAGGKAWIFADEIVVK